MYIMKLWQNPLITFIIGALISFLIIELTNNCFIHNDSKKVLNDIIKKLIRQSARWSTASTQDKSALIAMLHANYGAGYLWALKDIASDSEIKTATGIDILRFENEITDAMDKATKKMIHSCPQYAPESTYLTKLSGEGI